MHLGTWIQRLDDMGTAAMIPSGERWVYWPSGAPEPLGFDRILSIRPEDDVWQRLVSQTPVVYRPQLLCPENWERARW